MAKDKGKIPDLGHQQGSGEPDEHDDKDRGKFAGDNNDIKRDKSQGQDADHGQRGSQGGNKRGGGKG